MMLLSVSQQNVAIRDKTIALLKSRSSELIILSKGALVKVVWRTVIVHQVLPPVILKIAKIRVHFSPLNLRKV